MTIWFSSDHHFSHANVIPYCNRPFASVDEMNEELVRRWNLLVRPRDTVYYLGDFSLSRAAVEAYAKRLNGIKHLIAGNHDHCHPVHAKKEAKQFRMMEMYAAQGFESVQLWHAISVEGRMLEMCHLPYADDHYGEPRFPEHRPPDQGNWLLHGHVHQHWKVRGRQINVGVDVWDYAPVCLEKIQELIAAELEAPGKGAG